MIEILLHVHFKEYKNKMKTISELYFVLQNILSSVTDHRCISNLVIWWSRYEPDSIMTQQHILEYCVYTFNVLIESSLTFSDLSSTHAELSTYSVCLNEYLWFY